MLSDTEIPCVLGIEQVSYFLVVNLREKETREEDVIGLSIGRQRTSMYETSTVKETLGSAAVFCATRSNNSKQVRGMIPLSGPSTWELQDRL